MYVCVVKACQCHYLQESWYTFSARNKRPLTDHKQQCIFFHSRCSKESFVENTVFSPQFKTNGSSFHSFLHYKALRSLQERRGMFHSRSPQRLHDDKPHQKTCTSVQVSLYVIFWHLTLKIEHLHDLEESQTLILVNFMITIEYKFDYQKLVNPNW